jgi:hypothetical protein
MRTVLCALLLLAGAAWALPDGGQEREIAAAKARVQEMLDEAALLEQAGKREEAARVRAEAAELQRKIQGAAKPDDAPREPLHEALHRLEQAIGALDKAGYERMAGELRGEADKVRAEIRRREAAGPDGDEARAKEADFWRRNLDTLRIAMKGLAEAGKHDAADIMERAVHAHEMVAKGRTDPEAQEFMRRGPDNANLSEFLQLAAHCWADMKEQDKADRCAELGNFLRIRLEDQQRAREGDRRRAEERRDARPGPEDRIAAIEARLDKMERMLHAAMERLEQLDRERRERDRDRDRDDK